jgi:hypothetical protein
MPEARTWLAGTAVVLVGALAACDSSPASTPSPSHASKGDFCRTFEQLGPRTSPPQAADRLSQVGTPDDIDPTARHGFEILVDHLRDLPEGAHAGRIGQLVQDLKGDDAADVRAFIVYYAAECQGLAGDPPA